MDSSRRPFQAGIATISLLATVLLGAAPVSASAATEESTPLPAEDACPLADVNCYVTCVNGWAQLMITYAGIYANRLQTYTIPLLLDGIRTADAVKIAAAINDILFIAEQLALNYVGIAKNGIIECVVDLPNP